MDSKKTKELISQVLIDEKERAVSMSMTSDFNQTVQKFLKIKDTVHLNLQLKLQRDFIITPDLVTDKNILTQKQFSEFEKQSEKGGFSFWNWLESNCYEGYCSISKPIFNETYDLAFIRFGTVCGSLCGGRESCIYEFKNGKWVKVKTISSWVS